MTTIWIYWEQGWDNAPAPIADCARSWETQNPDIRVERLSAATIGQFIDLDDAFLEMTRNIRVQTRTDLYRLMLLRKHGGIWADATLFCARPIDDWLHLSEACPVALFHNPGPDRLVSSWFMAATPNADLLGLWLDELVKFLSELRDPSSPKGLRKIVQKLFQSIWSRDVQHTLKWWDPLPYQWLSLTPYYVLHYCYNRLYLTNPQFKQLADQSQALAADPAHVAQVALAAKSTQPRTVDLAGVPVHKLNWRKLPNDRKIADLLAEIAI